MISPGEAEVLEMWTNARNAGRPDRIARLTDALVGRDAPWDDATAALLTLTARLTGHRQALVTECTSCGSRIDVDVDLRDLLGAQRNADGRPPTVADMLRAARLPPEEAAVMLAAAAGVAPLAADELDRERPLLAPSLALACPDCATELDVPIDAVALAWAAIDQVATATIADVATLATTFGWTERDVLAVPPARRRQYCALARGGASG